VTPEGILDRIRVLDLSRGLAGPVAALLSAEAGAEVVKAERPPQGDLVRCTTAFSTWNRVSRARARPGPPPVGQHTTEVAMELGFSGEQIDALRAGGVLKGA